MQRWVKSPPMAGVNRAKPKVGVRYWDEGESWVMDKLLLKSNDLERVYPDAGLEVLTSAESVIAGPFILSFEGQDDYLLIVKQAETRTILDVLDTSGSLVKRFSVAWVASSAAVVHNKNEYYIGFGVGRTRDTGAVIPVDIRSILVYYNEDSDEVFFEILGMEAQLRPPVTRTLETTQTVSESLYEYGDVVVYYATEVDLDRDVESLPVMVLSVPEVVDGAFDTYGGEEVGTGEQYPVSLTFSVDLPTINPRATAIRVYRHYLGNYRTGDVTVSDVQRFFDGESFEGGLFAQTEIGDTTGELEFVDPIESILDPPIPYPQTVIGQDSGLALFPTPIKPKPFDVGTVFNDSLVVNDPSTSDQIIRYSPPGAPEYQPAPYFMYFATGRSDKIVGIHQVNNLLIVLMENTVARVNYLPTSDEFSALRGRVQSIITQTFGCVGRQASVRVDTARGSYVCWVSARGLEFTSGDGVDDLCPDFRSDVLRGDLEDVVLVNNEELQRLELYSSFERWDFYYHASHIKNGRLKLAGPSVIDVGDIAGLNSVVGGDSDEAAVYVATDERVLTDSAEFTGVTTWELGRFINTNNPYSDVEVTGLCFYATGSGTLEVTLRYADSGDGGDGGSEVGAVSWSSDGLYKVELAARGKIIGAQLEVSGEGWSVGPVWWRVAFSEADAT